MEEELHRRAVIGVKRKKFFQGQAIIDPETDEPYYEREYSDTLLIFRLKALRPEKYRDNQQAINVNTTNNILVISEEARAKLIERNRVALGGGN